MNEPLRLRRRVFLKRTAGVGAAVAFGRIGGVLAPYAGSWALESGGASQLFVTIAATMTMVFIALASVGRHIPRVSIGAVARSIATEPAGH